MLSLCGCQEGWITALKELGVPLGTLVLCDIDLEALGCVLVRHSEEDIRFPILLDESNHVKGGFGNVLEVFSNATICEEIMRDIVINVMFTSTPCQQFAPVNATRQGHDSPEGKLHELSWKTATELKRLNENLQVIFENVEMCGNDQVVQNDNMSYHSQQFPKPMKLNSQTVGTPENRNRVFINSLPPQSLCHEEDWKTLKDVLDKGSEMHPDVKVANTLMASKDNIGNLVFRDENDVTGTPFTAEERERIHGYSTDATKFYFDIKSSLQDEVKDMISKQEKFRLIKLNDMVKRKKLKKKVVPSKNSLPASDSRKKRNIELRGQWMGEGIPVQVFKYLLTPLLELYPKSDDDEL